MRLSECSFIFCNELSSRASVLPRPLYYRVRRGITASDAVFTIIWRGFHDNLARFSRAQKQKIINFFFFKVSMQLYTTMMTLVAAVKQRL